MHRPKPAVLAVALVLGCGGADAPPPPDTAAPVRAGPAFAAGAWSERTTPRPAFAVLRLRLAAWGTVALEVRRDAQLVQVRRLAAYGPDGALRWAVDEAAAERFSDVAVHPSGDVTLALEDTGVAAGGYALLRLSADGTVRARQALPAAATLPPEDRGATPQGPAFLFRSWAHVPVPPELPEGWLRVEAQGDDAVVAFLSWVDPEEHFPTSPTVDSGVMALRWADGAWAERWTRVVDGRHIVSPNAWSYDELRWRQASVRPLLALAEDGRVVVGRTWDAGRCNAVAATFGDGLQAPLDCILSASNTGDVEYQAFAFTVFSPGGAREGTRLYPPYTRPDLTREPVELPQRPFAELAVFDLAVRGTDVALVGTVVPFAPGRTVAYYPPAPGADATMTPYDGWVALLHRDTGAVRAEHRVDTGRAEVLAAARWASDGLVAVGAAGWDRWFGGMSVSRGASPLRVFVPDAAPFGPRVHTHALGGGERHFHLLAVDVAARGVVAAGLADAPMTHSGDGGQRAQLTYGGLWVTSPAP